MTKRRSARHAQPSAGPAGTQIEIGAGALVILLLVGAGAAAAWWVLGGRGASTAGSAAPTTAAVPSAVGLEATSQAVAKPEVGRTPDGDPFIGNPAAPVTIVAYSDYQCPNCRQFATEILPWLEQTWMARGVVRVVYRDFPVRGPESVDAALAAQCAGDQDRFWDMHDRLFGAQSGENVGTFTRDNLHAIAAAVGLDVDAYDACMAGERYRARVDASAAAARAQGFEGTPTYLINGRKTQGAIRIADWEQLFQLYQQDFARATQAVAP